MHGAQWLHAFVTRTAAVRERKELRELAKERSPVSGEVQLLCDFFPVAEWLLSSYDGTLVKASYLSPYSLLYGGDVKLYAQRILDFVRVLLNCGVTPVFFLAGPPGSYLPDFERQLPRLRACHERALERCQMVHQVCEGRGDLLQVEWRLSEDAAVEVKRALLSDGVQLIHCVGGAAREMTEYQRTHPLVLGSLSTDMELAVVAGSTLFPLHLFDVEGALGLHNEAINLNPAKVFCTAVDSSSLCRGLGLKSHSKLLDVSILCGNEFTHNLNQSLSPCSLLGLSSASVDSVVVWVKRQPCPLQEANELQEFLSLHPSYEDAIDQTHTVLGWEDPNLSDTLLENCGEGNIVLSVKIDVNDNTLLSIPNAVYWQWPVMEPVKLGQLCFTDLSLRLRRRLYELLGQEVVVEVGRTSEKSFTHRVVETDVSKELPLSDWSETQRLVALFHLITATGGSLNTNSSPLSLCVSIEKEEQVGIQLAEGDESILPKAVLACGCLTFMCSTVSESNTTPPQPHELEALLVTCLFCAASIPPSHLPDLPSSRGLTLAVHFSHVIQQSRLLATALRLSSILPPPSAVFYPLAYIPHHMAASVALNPSHDKLRNCSPSLVDAYCHFACLSSARSVKKLSSELRHNWERPNLGRLVTLFNEALAYTIDCAAALSPKVRLPPCSSPHIQFCFNKTFQEEKSEEEEEEEGGEGITRQSAKQATPECEEDKSLAAQSTEDQQQQVKGIESPRSDHDSNEMSSAQEFVALEECCYLSQSLALQEEREVEEEEEEVVAVLSEEEDEEGRWEGEGEGEQGNSDSGTEKRSLQNRDITAEGTAEGERYIPIYPSSFSSSSTSSATSRAVTPSDPLPWKQSSHELPIMVHRGKILALLASHRVVCIEGETGCGKSTQIPQFILDHALASNPPIECRVLVTQPRRVAAIKLSERVASERGERVGHTVGYCVGGEQHYSSSHRPALTYCTTGYLLQVLIMN